MYYKLVFSDRCKKQIDKLDNSDRILLESWLRKHLVKCNNPKTIGKPLVGNKKGLWRYRVGNYRLIVQITEKELLILALDFGHRSTMYK